jgi:hypothetical protein
MGILARSATNFEAFSVALPKGTTAPEDFDTTIALAKSARPGVHPHRTIGEPVSLTGLRKS